MKAYYFPTIKGILHVAGKDGGSKRVQSGKVVKRCYCLIGLIIRRYRVSVHLTGMCSSVEGDQMKNIKQTLPREIMEQ